MSQINYDNRYMWRSMMEDEREQIKFSPIGRGEVAFLETDIDSMMDFSNRSGLNGDIREMLSVAHTWENQFRVTFVSFPFTLVKPKK
jgi:hypothetical protein